MAAKPKENTERIQVFFSTETLNKLKEESKLKGISVSGLVRMIILEYFQNKIQK